MKSLGYYGIKQGILQQNLSKYYRFEKVDIPCKQFNMFVNMIKKNRQQEETKENLLLLDPRDERNYMKDRGILEKYIDLEKTMLNGDGKKRSDGHAV